MAVQIRPTKTPSASGIRPIPKLAPKRSATLDDAALAVIERATEVIGNRDRALRWMGTPVQALNYATPVSLLGSKKGRNAILATLHNLEHGVL